MAKKHLDDSVWDHSLDYDFEDPFAPVSNKQKRGVITRVATNFAQGAKDALTTPSSLKTIAGNVLPKGYGEAINFADDVYRQGEELHNIAMKELAPSIPAMRRITQRHLPNVKRFLPKGVSDRLDEFSMPQSRGASLSTQQLEEQALQKSMAEVFGVQMEADARQNAENKVERAMHHAQATKMSREQLHSLTVMQQGMMRLVNYQDDVTNRFQRRSLELQTRQYFVTRDSLRLQVETARRVNAHLEALVTNSSMPDIAKQDLAHTAKQTFRNRLLGSMQSSAGRFAQNYVGNMAKRAQAGVRDLTGGVNSAMDFSDMGGEDVPMMDMIAQMLGKGAVTGASSLFGRRGSEWLSKKSPGMAQFGALLQRGVRGAPFQLNKYARSATTRTGTAGLFEDGLKSLLGTHKMDSTIGKSGIGNMDKPATFDRLSRLSLVEIIPGLLSRIEHNTARVLDSKAERQIFNIDRKGFTNIQTASNDMSKRIFDPSRRASAKQDVNDFINEVVGKHPISASTRKGFFRQLLLDSGEGTPFDPTRYMTPGSDTPELTASAKTELGKILSNVGMLANGKRDQIWMNDREEKFHKLDFGAVAPISGASVYRSAGYRELLDDQGLVDRDGDTDKLRLSKILDMIEEANYSDIKVKEKTFGDRFNQHIRDKVDGVSSLYATAGGQAVLDAGKLKAGAYRDAVTHAVITKWEDIKGPVRDMTLNEIVVDVNQLSMGLIDSKGKSYSFSLSSLATGTMAWTADTVTSARATFTAKTDQVKDILNARGEVVLAAWKLRAGKYRDAVTKAVITKVEDIAGPVVDENDETVVTAADIANVLTEQGGRRLDNAVTRMRERTASMLSQASTTLNPVFGTSTAKPANNGFGVEADASTDYSDLVRLNSEQVELLKAIAQILAAQGLNGDSGQDPQYRRGFLDSIAIGGVKGALAGAKGIVKGSWWWTKKVVGGLSGGVGLAGRSVGAVASGGAHHIGNMVRGIKDIYVKGKRKPVMTAQRIKLGHYQDVNTTKKVVRWTDVTGPVIDLKTGDAVIDQDDFDAGIYTKGPAGLVRLATKSLMGFGSAVASFYGNALALPFKVASAGIKAVGTALKFITNKQVDVYVKGESSPRLMATKMKTGRYYNINPKKMGKVVSNYSDIYGEIKELQPGSHKAQKDDKTVLYEEEITDPGLVGRWGLSLRTPLSRVIGAVGGMAVSVVKGAGAIFGGALRGLGKLFGGMMGGAGGLLGAPFKFLGALLNPFEKHGAKQVEWLEKIFSVLDSRLPGKKARKGSFQEQFERRDEKAKKDSVEAERTEKDNKFGIGGLLSFFKNKTKGLFGGGGSEEEDEDDDDGDTTIIAGGGGGGGDSKEAKRKRRAGAKKSAKRRKGKLGMLFRAKDAAAAGLGKVKGKLPSFLGSPGKIAATTAGVMGGSFLLDKALGENSTSRNAVSTGADVAIGASTASFLSGAVGGPTIGGMLGLGAGGTTAAVGGGAAAAVLGAPIWIPLAIGAAAVTAAGAGIYFAHKQFKYGKLTPVRRFRYLQYGVAPGDAGNNKKIFKLEELLLDHVGEKGGGLEILGKSNSGGKDIAMENVYELMDMNDGWFSNKNQQRQVFNKWYAERFKPIFLTWVKALRDVEPTMALLDADEKLAGEKQAKVLQKAWSISRNLYANPFSPFEGESAVTDFNLIEDAYNLAIKESGKTDAERSKDKRKSLVKAATTFLMPGGMIKNYFDNQSDEEKAKKDGAIQTASKMEATTGLAMLGTVGAVKNTKGVDDLLSSPLARLGKVSALAAIRYRAYGLSDLDLDRVRALAALESLVFQRVSISSSGVPHFLMDAEQTYNASSGLFGLTAGSVKDRQRWAAWFGHRFLPVCLAYIKSVKSLAPSADLQSPERTFKADKLTEVAQQLLNAKDPDGRSIWHWTTSPWSAEEKLNSDSNAIAGSMLALKNSADKKVMAEEKVSGQDAAVKKNSRMLAGMLDNMKSGAKSVSDMLFGDKGNRNLLGRAVDGVGVAASSVFQGSKNAFEQVSGGVSNAFTSLSGKLANGKKWPGLNADALWKKVAPLIASGESMGGNYDAQNGVAGNITPGLSSLSIGAVYDMARRIGNSDNHGGKFGPKTGAAGKYQFIPKTLLAAMKQAGLKLTDMFSPDNQEKMGRGLFDMRVAAGRKAGPVGILDQLAMEWASLPSPSKGGRSWYHGDSAGNRAHGGMERLEELMAAVTGSMSAEAGTLPQGAGGSKPEVTNTTTTANGPAGGVGPAEAKASASGLPDFSIASLSTPRTDKPGFRMAGAAPAGTFAPSLSPAGTPITAKAANNGTSSLASGGGFAAAMSGVAYGAAVPAPSITSTASLDAAATRSNQSAAESQAAGERQRVAREQQTRAAEAQTQRLSQTDQAAMARVGDILLKSLETQQRIEKNTQLIEKNTLDTVSVLRDLLRKSGDSGSNTATTTAPVSTRPSLRPTQQYPDKVPVSVRFTQPNG